MKFRNKETGKIRDFEFIAITKDMDVEFAKYAHHAPVMICRSIDQLNEEFEDYKPKEPLIKNEKIRKVVRAWAEANGDSTIVVHSIDGETTLLNGSFTGLNIELDIMDELEDGKAYTIDELCGDEEAPEPLEPSFIDLDKRIKEKEEND